MDTQATRTYLVTGGAGFIGSCFVRRAVAHGHRVINLDKLTYAASPEALTDVMGHHLHRFVEGDIRDGRLLTLLFTLYRPTAVIHFAAETHVDRSIDAPAEFISTNVVGTQTLLDAALVHYHGLPAEEKASFRFLHVSTDEVFGSLGPEGRFSETTAYDPRSPYSASKAAADHLVRAWFHTFGLPVLLTNCTNNYGPWQFPEKLIPVMVAAALAGQPLPVYGAGDNVRDWLYVEDHCEALERVLERGEPGGTWCIGGEAERTNVQVVTALCESLDQLCPRADGRPHAERIRYVKDRPGHDRRYAMDIGKIKREMHWRPRHSFEEGLASTVRWYVGKREWLLAAREPSARQGLRMAG